MQLKVVHRKVPYKANIIHYFNRNKRVVLQTTKEGVRDVPAQQLFSTAVFCCLLFVRGIGSFPYG